VLGRYVRQEGILSLEEGVRRMTSLPAGKFRLTERGEVREGYSADLVVLDPDKVVDTATFEEPRQYPKGISHVLVNGVPVVTEGQPASTQAGQVVRRG
jgi:N-acyl-D-amino-acid deacylase